MYKFQAGWKEADLRKRIRASFPFHSHERNKDDFANGNGFRGRTHLNVTVDGWIELAVLAIGDIISNLHDDITRELPAVHLAFCVNPMSSANSISILFCLAFGGWLLYVMIFDVFV